MSALTTRQLAGNQRRTLKAMQARLADMAADWADMDEYFVSRLNEAAEKLQALHAEMVEFSTEAA